MVDSLPPSVAPPEPEAARQTDLVVGPICAALSFLTILPCPRRTFSALEMGRAVAYFPLVGLLIGALVMFSAVVVLARVPFAVAAALVLTFWVTITGALHLDGFLDCRGKPIWSSVVRHLREDRAEQLEARAVNDQDWDVGLHLVFTDKAAHDAYQEDPMHVKFVEENKPGWAAVRVFDSLV